MGNREGTGWSDVSTGPGGLAAVVVAELGLPASHYVRIRESLYAAMTRMYADPRWSQIKNPDDAHALVREYL